MFVEPEFKEMDFFWDEVFIAIRDRFVPDAYAWPDGVTAEEATTKEADQWGKWSESTVRVKVDGVVAVEMTFNGKHGDSLDAFTVKDETAIYELLKRTRSK